MTKREKAPETAVDASAWTEDEKNTFNQTLLDLQETIQALLNPPAPSNLA